MPGRFLLRQDLTIVDLTHRAQEVLVRVRTRAGRSAHIEFSFTDESALNAQVTALRRWMHLRTPVTYVRAGAQGALIDDRAVFEAALGDVDYS